MTRTPTGRLLDAENGVDLVLTRTFRAPIDDVWASLTEPERTARWFGPWEGEAAPGRTIRVRMTLEEGAPWSDLDIEACEPPHRLAVSLRDEYGHWVLELLLTTLGDRTELRFVQHLVDATGIGEVGPGWEYYLDCLAAAHDGTAMPPFDDYHPPMKAYYEQLRPE
ncbi:SRPBCC family protein [Micromonospora sp. DT48]|uniref:SRPBCC family protein n=1 Tax=unclassified Micromonospora TaxID=2617518 RepID=UPI0012BD364C|nr:SRPBCC family protein [Micromonospora sp. CP22]MTK02369.1 SRPBCC family protein [Micromonospora sp. CP22]